MIYHGLARSTGDVDFFYEPAKANAARLFRALKDFWHSPIPSIAKPEVLLEPRMVFQFGFPPNRIDLMNSISGVSFAAAWKTKVTDTFTFEGEIVPVDFIGIDALIKNKRSLARPKDKADLVYLTAAAKQSPP